MMIRVLQVVTHMNRGGLESMLMNYYRRIDRNSMQFDFLTHRPYNGDFGDEIIALGGKIFHLPPLNPFSKSYKKSLRSFFADHPEYKVVHVHQDCMSSIILKEALHAGFPVRIAHSHNSSQDKNIKYLLKLLYRGSIPKYATDLFACGEMAGQWMFRGVPFTVLNNAIDTGAFAFCKEKRDIVRTDLGISENQFVIGHVGRFSYPKNHRFLVECFAAVHKKNADAVLLLVGDDKGELGSVIHNMVHVYGLDEHVIFAGVRNDVADMMQAMDVFVFPSHYEGLPVTLIEAQASGLPCLVSDKVPGECKKTDLVEQVSLDRPVEYWADRILSHEKCERRITTKDMKNAGYDITENAIWLQNYYLSKAKVNE